MLFKPLKAINKVIVQKLMLADIFLSFSSSLRADPYFSRHRTCASPPAERFDTSRGEVFQGSKHQTPGRPFADSHCKSHSRPPKSVFLRYNWARKITCWLAEGIYIDVFLVHEPISIDIQKYSTSTRYSKIPRRPPETIFRLFLKTAKDVSMTTCLASNCLRFVVLLQKEIHNSHSNTPLRQ